MLGLVSAPALGRRWWAIRGEGAFADGERCHVSAVERIEDAAVSTTSARGMPDGWRRSSSARGRTAASATSGSTAWLRKGRSRSRATRCMEVWDYARGAAARRGGGRALHDVRRRRPRRAELRRDERRAARRGRRAAQHLARTGSLLTRFEGFLEKCAADDRRLRACLRERVRRPRRSGSRLPRARGHPLRPPAARGRGPGR